MSIPAAQLNRIGSPPIRYQASFEQVESDEPVTNAQLVNTITRIQTKVHEDSGHAKRGVHAKSHGILVGELRILDDLPAVLAQGLFATPATYPAVLRFSTIPGDVLDDNISVPRGLAVKVIGVRGERVSGSENDVTQDFTLANGSAFSKADPKSFSHTLKLLAATTDKAPGLKKALSAVMRGAEKLLESVGGESPTLMTLGGYPETNLLGDSYYSQTPILFGDYIAKVSVQPHSPALRALIKAPLGAKGKPDRLHEAVIEFFAGDGGEWDLLVQLCTDIDSMPIEDASKPWPEDKSPYIPVAHISVPRQGAWNSVRETLMDETLSFSPWHALAAHRPLGAINRVRKLVYDMAARFRAQHNGIRIVEPNSLADLPR